MRYATLEERKQFYQLEFDVERMQEWLRKVIVNPRFAVVIGRHTGISPYEYEEDSSTTILINRYGNFEDLRGQVLDFLPESVYYDQNVYDRRGKVLGEEIAFDLDPENLTCPVHGSLEAKMRVGQGLSFCKLELNMLKGYVLRLHDTLRETFSRIRLVYSGRGYHLHVADRDSYHWTYRQRRELAGRLEKEGYPIDSWVTAGRFRMIRLPFSLHGMVSRIVLPLSIGELQEFDPIHDQRCIPEFLRATSSSSSSVS